MTNKKTLTPKELGQVLTQKLNLATVQEAPKCNAVAQSETKATDTAFNALIEKIKQARQDIKALKGYVSDALGLALCDYFVFSNKNSLQVLTKTPVDFNKSGRGVACINLYNMRSYLDSVLSMTLSGIDTLSVRVDPLTFKKPPCETREDFMSWYRANSLLDYKKPSQTVKMSNYDRLKQMIGKLTDDEKAKLTALLKK